jgi:hypothetical protein
MSLETKYRTALDALDRALHRPQEPSLDLLANIVSGFCTRISDRSKTETFDRLIHLAKIGAWTEVAFSLIALELPLWRVRRLVYESGEWLCSLSHQPNLPMAFDDCVEATHQVLPMAVLCAFVEACRRRDSICESVSVVPHIEPWLEQIMCCENYR